MPSFTESNITLSFPDHNFFRLCDCPAYQSLSGHHFKEMDVTWFENESNTYWFFELKDYSQVLLFEEIEKKTLDIVKKAVDSLSVFLSFKHNYSFGRNFNTCFPVAKDDSARVKFITIIHCGNGQKEYVQYINEHFKSRFKPYAELFGVSNYTVVEHSRAISIFPNNIVN